ncbi:hypothetical protein SAMN02745111_02203 [Eubacterium uniforme]|uniref:Uncharacterized protein n=1 Tax=Eubacterium uniforme TaxID=39495 RepID=A0A1T4W220_9FIRM|nr:hypothetical protein [Eubacterium uniforme]SKA71344.1 hypothetical protein SAMN02745111_02203 [Eubacterium uniforme]
MKKYLFSKDIVNIICHTVLSELVFWWGCIAWVFMTDYEDDEHKLGVMLGWIMILGGAITILCLESFVLKKVNKKRRYLIETIVTIFLTVLITYIIVNYT